MTRWKFEQLGIVLRLKFGYAANWYIQIQESARENMT